MRSSEMAFRADDLRILGPSPQCLMKNLRTKYRDRARNDHLRRFIQWLKAH